MIVGMRAKGDASAVFQREGTGILNDRVTVLADLPKPLVGKNVSVYQFLSE